MSRAARPPEGVGWTAVLVAAQRGRESLSDRPLFRDPLAELLFLDGELPTSERAPWINVRRSGQLDTMTRLMGDYVALRTRFFDDALEKALAGGIRQVVSLGAGLDGRSYRMDLPEDAVVFEIDRPEVLAYRAELAHTGALHRTCTVIELDDDLAADWPRRLLEAQFDPSSPTVWLVEGLTIYLSRADNDLWLKRVSDLSAPVSRLLFEVLDDPTPATLAGDAETDRGFAVFQASLESGPPKPPEPWVASEGWQATSVSLIDLAAQHDRALTQWLDARRDGMRVWLLECRR